MGNQRKEFKEWMIKRKTTKKDGNTYTTNTVSKCSTVLNTTLNKMGIPYFPDGQNTIFTCDKYSDFLALDATIRSHPGFEDFDGKGKGQRWIHNGLLLYGYYLLDKEEISEEAREDDHESIVISHGTEGRRIDYYTTRYERKKKNRDAAIAIHGLKCQCCGFDFQEKYGELGKGFIEVHHTVPLASRTEEIEVNPETDLVCLCSNCHRMVHRKKDSIVSVEELRNIMNQ